MRLILALIVCFLPDIAASRDNGQWADQPTSVRQWFSSLMQPDAPMVSCCGEADAFESDDFEIGNDGDLIAIITGGHGVIPNGTRLRIPSGKVKWNAGNPTGHGIVFVGSGGQVYCYVAPGGV